MGLTKPSREYDVESPYAPVTLPEPVVVPDTIEPEEAPEPVEVPVEVPAEEPLLPV